jgi:cytochrome-b5 reductase
MPVAQPAQQNSKTASVSAVANNAAKFGLLVTVAAGAYYASRSRVIPAPHWMRTLFHRDQAGSGGVGFTKGLIVGGGIFAAIDIILAQQFSNLIRSEKSFTSYPPHMKVPKRTRRDTLLQRGFLDPVQYAPLPVTEKTLIAPNVYRLAFALPTSGLILGLPIGQHVTIKADVDGESVARSYTPVSNNADRGVLELVVKVYPDGKLTNGFLSKLGVGDEVLFRGPKGAMRYHPGLCKKIGMVAGGSGITPMFQVIRAVCEHDRDTTEITLIYANRTEQDILLREELDTFARRYPKNFKVHYMLDNPPEDWKFGSGYVTQELIEEKLPKPSADNKVMLCGPPGMVNAAKRSLVNLGFEQPGASAKMSDQIFVF